MSLSDDRDARFHEKQGILTYKRAVAVIWLQSFWHFRKYFRSSFDVMKTVIISQKKLKLIDLE